MQSTSSHFVAASVSVLALAVLSACGGAGDAAEAGTSDGEIATLTEATDAGGDAAAGDTGAAGEADGGAESSEPSSVDDVALELSECLRGEGLDVPDIGVDADGNLQLRDVVQDIGPGTAGLRDAFEACADILEGVSFGGRGGGVRDDPAVADALLEFSECVRDQGFEDVPDLTQRAPGNFAGGAAEDGQPDGAPPEAGQGRGEAGFGDRNTRLATQLDLDPEDPDVIAALEACSPILDNALADAGVGRPAGG